jgi:transcriptional regulator with XRE-family HTH domain
MKILLKDLKRTEVASGSFAVITPAQIRAARALLGWTQAALAERCNLSGMAIKNIEREAADPKLSTLNAIAAALGKGGVVFLGPGDVRSGGHGVRLSAAGDATT